MRQGLGDDLVALEEGAQHPVGGKGLDALNQCLDGDAAAGEFVLPLAKAFGRLQQATAWVAQQGLRDPEEAGAAATDYLRLFALTALAYLWARMAEASLRQPDGMPAEFYAAKLATARYFMQRVLPGSSGLFAAIMAGKAPVMDLEDSAF